MQFWGNAVAHGGFVLSGQNRWPCPLKFLSGVEEKLPLLQCPPSEGQVVLCKSSHGPLQVLSVVE